MSRNHHPSRLNMLALAREGAPISDSTLISTLERVAAEANGLHPEAVVHWQARAELRPKAGVEDEVWLHLHADASVPLTCQRCMQALPVALEVDRWYRFVADEETAFAEDDAAEEDLLAMEPQFDLLNVLEDELLMAMPPVPMHASCPIAPVFQAGELESESASPNPFSVLRALKKDND